ncbi:MAG: transglutaminase-like domain-containing protein, partial [Oscillospiraceae bacterium]|nr:transglutaminase-like domain-containing protein [Oscillospiraceae bacterium]
TAVLALAYIRWWIPVSAFGVIIVGVAIFQFFTGTFAEWINYWAGFIGWVAEGALFNEIYSNDSSERLLQFFIVLPVLVTISPIVSRSFLLPVVVCLSAGVTILSYVISPADMSVVICFCAAGIIILLPGIYAGIINKHGETDKKITVRMQIVAIPVAILTVLLAFLITPQDTRYWQSRTLVTFINDVNYLLRGSFNNWPEITPNFSMYNLGFQSETDRLGGPVELNNQTLLIVTGPGNVLLKGRVFDVYTGTNWEVGKPDGDIRFDSILLRRYRREAFGQDRPLGGRRTEEFYREISKEIELSITHATSQYHSLFTTGRVRGINFSPQLINPVAFFNMRSEVYMHQRMPMGHGIYLRTRVWDRSKPDFENIFLELEAVAAEESDSRYDDILERYTVLPIDFPYIIRDIAAHITENDDTAFSKVMSIVKWLNENMEYSLDVEEVPEDMDFTEHFLETGTGYCVYYATALAVMARSEGIPSRYVIGFALEDRGYGSSSIATGETAHAWVEIYFKGIGWVEIDPLSWNSEEPLNSGETAEAPPEQPQTPPSVPETPPLTPDEEAPLGDIIQEIQEERIYIYLIVIPIVIIFMILFWNMLIRYLMGRKYRQYSMEKIISKANENYPRLKLIYDDIMKQLSLLDMVPLPGETLLMFSNRTDSRIKFEKAGFSAVAKDITDYRFAGILPQKQQLENACEYHKILEDHLQEWLGKWRYLFKRAIR